MQLWIYTLKRKLSIILDVPNPNDSSDFLFEKKFEDISLYHMERVFLHAWNHNVVGTFDLRFYQDIFVNKPDIESRLQWPCELQNV